MDCLSISTETGPRIGVGAPGGGELDGRERLSGARLTDADVTGADLRDADLGNARIVGIVGEKATSLEAARNLSSAFRQR